MSVPIEVDRPESPGWWTKRLFNRLFNRQRQNRLALLQSYYDGAGRLPDGASAVREMYEAFQRRARTNFAELVVDAVGDRMSPVGFRTAGDGDETGDERAHTVWQGARMDVVAADVHSQMLALGESYVIVGPVDRETGVPVITAEDPHWLIGEPDPMVPGRLRAALKVMHDDVAGEQRAYLYLPGRVWVHSRKASVAPRGSAVFDARSWRLDAERSGEVPAGLMPVVQFVNRRGKGEFETHLDVLDRIAHQTLQRMVIATMQAFRQRAIMGLPEEDEDGEPIDYSDVFRMDPGALWELPDEVKMWESGQVDLTPILSAVKDDIMQLAAVTRTPMYMLMPAGANQSAEGATAQREGLLFKVADRIARCSTPWARVMSLAFHALGEPERAALSKLETIWAPPAHLSLAERADAAAKAQQDIPRRSRLIHIWGHRPAAADRMMTEWADDQLLSAQIAAAAAAGVPESQPPTPAAPPPTPDAAGLATTQPIDQGVAPA